MLVKRNISACIAFLLAFLLVLPMGVVPANADNAEASSPEEMYSGLEDDFYEAVNQEQFEAWEIPGSLPAIDHFSVLEGENKSRLSTIVTEAVEDVSIKPGSDEYNVGALWTTAFDETSRNAGGYGRANEFIAQIDAATNVNELMDALITVDRTFGLASFFNLALSADDENSDQYVYYLGRIDTGLSREEWFSEEEQTVAQVQLYREYIAHLWELNGTSPEEAAAIAEEVTTTMKDLASSSLTLAQQYDADNYYNVYKLGDLDALYKGILSMDRIYDLFEGSSNDKMVVLDPGLIEATATFFKSADLDLLKHYVKSCLFADLAQYVSMDSQNAYREYYKQIYGLDEMTCFEDDILAVIDSELPFECGRLYTTRYFSEESRADIQAMIDDIVEVYEQRITSLDWMSDATKKEALTKLKSIEARIGAPDVWPQDQYELKLLRPEDGGLYVDNLLAIYEVQQNVLYAQKDKPVDKTIWAAPPQMVNAFYDPTSNSITLAAGILQAPFYDVDAVQEENLAHIGMVIAHEITHAFDSSGSQYDENGNLRDWWTPEDAEQFEALSQEVVDYFDDQEVNGMAVDGELTLTENIADLGAVACVTEVALQRGLDLQVLYAAYGQLWAEEIRDEYLANLLATDTHSPSKVRTNAVLSALDEFYEAFDIDEDDEMYVKPEDRPRIW